MKRDDINKNNDFILISQKEIDEFKFNPNTGSEVADFLIKATTIGQKKAKKLKKEINDFLNKERSTKMGTRGLLMIKESGSTKLAQYNHYDSYIKGGLGEDVVSFIVKTTREEKWDQFKKGLANVISVDSDYVLTDEDIERHKRYQDTNVSTGDDIYALLRGLQNGVVLSEILEGRVFLMEDYIGFFDDGIFCEYAYLLDLDEMVLYIYENGKNLLSKFSFSELVKHSEVGDKEWLKYI